jgi:tetratricopeptide (TPR) repeat protein
VSLNSIRANPSDRCHPRSIAILLLALILGLSFQLVNAKHMMPDLVNVPVSRLIRNLDLLAKNNPKSVEARFNLARAHAMAYAQRTESLEVRKGRENEGVWFGYEPKNVPFTINQIYDNTRLTEANEHLAKALAHYAAVVEMAPDNLAAALGYAWCLEQSGQKRKAIRKYRMLIKRAWESEKNLKDANMGWHSITAEAAGYLIPLLEKDADKAEINTLRERIKQMEAVPRPITPIVIPLRSNLTASDLEDHSAAVAFDADGTGLQKRWTWIARDAGWLVYDPHKTGQITSALQLFGGVTFWMFWDNGYNALSALDDDGNGKLAGKELDGLAIWSDINTNGICEPGDVKPLAEWGIVAISCSYVRDLRRPDRIAYSPRGVFFRDGSSRPTYDIILHPAVQTVD